MRKKSKSILALFLTICLLCGLVPQVSLTASAVISTGTAMDPVAHQALQEKIKAGGVVEFPAGEIYVDKPFVIQKDNPPVTITSSSAGRTIVTACEGVDWSKIDGLFEIAEGCDVTFKTIGICGNELARCIYVNGGETKVTLDHATIQAGNANGSSGAGVSLAAGGGTLNVTNDCLFLSNKTSTEVPNGGGAIYVGEHWKAHFFKGEKTKAATFTYNEAHSGACIYAYNSDVWAEDCWFGDKHLAVPLKGFNHAGQRGGAIHSHGNVVLTNCLVRGNSSGQYGGGIYVSASNGVKGNIVLENTEVVLNDADANGGGIFLAADTALFLRDRSSVTDNQVIALRSESNNPQNKWENNVFHTNSRGAIVICDDSVGEVGVSTANPYDRKPEVYSYATSGLDLKAITLPLQDSFYYPFAVNTSFVMPKGSKNEVITYDSGLWKLVDISNDPEAGQSNPELCVEGNMWLRLNVEGAGPHVVFDYNLPGKTALVLTPEMGSKLDAGNGWPGNPNPSVIKKNGVIFTFLGWYTDPVDGDSVDPAKKEILVTGDVVYYAHWAISHEIPPIPVDGDMYLVYFDQNYPGGGFTSSYMVTGTFTFEVPYEFTVSGHKFSGNYPITVDIPWDWPGDPYREGYDFNGWSLSATGGALVSNSWKPTAPSSTLYAQWTARSYDLTWKENYTGGRSSTTSQKYDTTVIPPSTLPTRTGYEFTGWYLDSNCTIPLTSGTLVKGDADFFAGWTPKEYTITWDANYTGGGITSIKQYYDEKLYDMPAPTREGYGFIGWNTERDGSGVSGDPNDYGTIRQDETFYAQWDRKVKSYTVTIDWDDLSNNDNVRPESITVQLMANGIPALVNNQPVTYTFNASEHTGDTWSHPFHGLPVTDVVSNEIVYSVAITSTVSDEYSYGIENKSAELGYILMTHSLIVRDVDTYVVWDDNNDQDGIRPATVSVRLYANNEPVDDETAKVALSGSGNTWFYQFRDVQKYYTDAAGNKGQQIDYTLRAMPTNSGELEGYDIEYRDYTIILRHKTATVSRTVDVAWQDSNNQDGKRPATMMVQLYADNVPLEGQTVTLSDANKWSHTWDNLDKYTDGGREVVYSARVTSTLVDYTAKSSGMTIEMTYVPSSTSISAFVTWTDEGDADGLRPDYITAQLVADGKPTNKSQVLSATNGWTVSWDNFPIYKDGKRIEYTFEVDVPEGYTADYHGVYDITGLSAVLTHERITQSLTGKIVWDDRDNQSGARMGEVTVLLRADGQVIDERQRVTINADTDWEHVFDGLNKYRDHGEEIRYSIILVSSSGQYAATTNGMTITMNLNPEYVDVPFEVIWNDNNDSDGVRPHEVKAVLLVDGQPSGKTQLITAKTDWATVFTHLDYSGPSGVYRYKVELDEVPEGYDAKEADNAVVLKRVAETKNVTATVIWQDNSDQYAQRPKQVTLTLYADYLDGNGPQNTGIVEKCKATNGWEHIFENVPVLHNGKRIVYSVKASGDLTNYTMLEDGMDVYMKHKGYDPGDVTTEYVATVIWHNNYHHNPEKPTEVTLVLQDNQGKTYKRIVTKASSDTTGYTWWYTFSNLPTFQGSTPLTYELSVETPQGYIAKIMGQTIILTQVKDIPVRVDWYDEGCDLSVRPESLELYLRANDGDTQTSITLRNEDPDNEPWHGTFMDCPVWVDGESEEPINYTWIFSNADLEAVGYTAAYDYSEGVEEDGKTVYPIDLTRAGEEMTVPITIVWNDEGDQDGVRPETVKLNLYGEETDISQTVTINGNNTDKNWRTTSMAVPVRRDHTLVGYTAEVTEAKDANGQNVLTHYLAEVTTEGTGKNQAITITMTHTPETQERESTIIWADETKEGGLTRFPITIELVANNQVLKTKTVSIEEGEGQSKVTVRWDDVPVYYDHGKVYKDFTVRATAAGDKPADHVIREDGLDVTVERVQFQLTGRVVFQADSNSNPAPIPTILVSLSDATGKVIEQTYTDKDGYYAFTVSPGSYSVRANIALLWSSPYQTADIKDLCSDTIQNFTFSQQIPICECEIKVVRNNGTAAKGAEVNVVRPSQAYSTTLTTNADGICNITLPHGNYYFYASYVNEKGVCYLAETTPYFYGNKQTFKIILPPEGTGAISGTVQKDAKDPVPDIVVQCYRIGDGSYVGVETKTDENGNFTLGGLIDGTYKVILKDQNKNTIPLPQEIYFTIPGTPRIDINLTDYVSEDPTPSGYGTLAGVVTDKNGQPMDKAQVVVTDKSTGSLVKTLTTTPDGAFETQLPAGEYTVNIQKPFDNTTDLPIRVDDDAASREDGPVTADSFTIFGEVLDEDGQPKKGVTVYLYGEDGQLVLVNVMESEVEESAPAEDEDEGIMEAMVSGVLDAMEDVEDAMIAKVEEVLAEIVPAGADKSEADTDQDADETTEYGTVSLTDSGYVRMDETVTTEDGKYIFAGLPAGRYVVKIAEGIGGNGGSTDIPVVAGPLPEIPDDADLTITTDSYTVTGVVDGNAGVPVNGATVKLLDEAGKEVARLTTGKDGTYQFEALPEGNYTVNISYPDLMILASGDVTISDGSFATFPGQLVTGTVKDSKGNALPNMTVTLTNEAKYTYTAVTDKDGGYRVVVPDGKYTVEINVNGKTASKAITVNGKPVSADLTVAISTGTTPGGTTTPSGNTPSGSGGSGSGGSGGSGGLGGGSGSGGGMGGGSSVEQPKTVLSGIVTDKDGNGVEGATVTAVDTKTGETYTATTGPDGKYNLAVPKGSYTITITYGSISSNPKQVTASKDTTLASMTLDNLGKLVHSYVTGYSDGTFGGDRHISRSEVAALISRVSAGFDASKTYPCEFKDVADGVWYANNLGYCVEAGLIQGRGNGHFDPTANITRAEFAAIVARFLDLPNEVGDVKVSYPDTEGNWAEGYIAQLTAKGIVQGKGDGKFDPDANITRYEAVTMLNRALERTPDKAVLDALAANRTIRVFPDLAATHWAYYQVLEAANDHYHK